MKGLTELINNQRPRPSVYGEFKSIWFLFGSTASAATTSNMNKLSHTDAHSTATQKQLHCPHVPPSTWSTWSTWRQWVKMLHLQSINLIQQTLKCSGLLPKPHYEWKYNQIQGRCFTIILVNMYFELATVESKSRLPDSQRHFRGNGTGFHKTLSTSFYTLLFLYFFIIFYLMLIEHL